MNDKILPGDLVYFVFKNNEDQYVVHKNKFSGANMDNDRDRVFTDCDMCMSSDLALFKNKPEAIQHAKDQAQNKFVMDNQQLIRLKERLQREYNQNMEQLDKFENED